MTSLPFFGPLEGCPGVFFGTGYSGDGIGPSLVGANVLVQLEHLRAQPCVADALAKNQINLHGWVYDIVTGTVRAYSTNDEQFAAL